MGNIVNRTKINTHDNFMAMPIEMHDTAPWASIEEINHISRASIPNKTKIRNAKEWFHVNK